MQQAVNTTHYEYTFKSVIYLKATHAMLSNNRVLLGNTHVHSWVASISAADDFFFFGTHLRHNLSEIYQRHIRS